MRSAKDAFLLKEWLAGDADARLSTDSTLAEGVSCDEAGCVAEMADGAFVALALALRADALADDCERAALVVTARQAPPSCPSPVIDRERSRRQGAMTLRWTGTMFAVESARPKGMDRPWSPATPRANLPFRRAPPLRARSTSRRLMPTSRPRTEVVQSADIGVAAGISAAVRAGAETGSEVR